MSFQAWTVERGKALLLGTYPDAGMCTRVLRNASEGGAIVQGGEIVRTPKGTKDTVASLIAQAAREHHRTHPETPVAVVEAPAPAVELPAVVVPEEVPAPVAEEIDLGAELAAIEKAFDPDGGNIQALAHLYGEGDRPDERGENQQPDADDDTPAGAEDLAGVAIARELEDLVVTTSEPQEPVPSAPILPPREVPDGTLYAVVARTRTAKRPRSRCEVEIDLALAPRPTPRLAAALVVRELEDTVRRITQVFGGAEP